MGAGKPAPCLICFKLTSGEQLVQGVHHEHEFNPDPYWCVNNKFPNGESYKDVEARISDFIDHLKINFPNQHIAIVAHKAPQFAFDVLLGKKTWEQAIAEDWRIEKKWQPGWSYSVSQ